MMPNIVMITTHDSGVHFGCYGAEGVRTPAIDRLASEGIRFTSMYSSASMCSPSRGTLLTGMWPDDSGLLGLSGRSYQYRFDDSDLVFDSVFPLTENGRRRSATEVAGAATDDIRASVSTKTPFYLQVGFLETYTPCLDEDSRPDRIYGTWVPPYTGYPDDDGALNHHIASLQASIHRFDEAVGLITSAIRAGA